MERTRDDKEIDNFDQFPTSPSPTAGPTEAPLTTTTQVNRGTIVFSMSTTTPANFDDGKYMATTQPPLDVRTSSGKYTTARRLETSRTTPFYTPTIPTIATRFESSARALSQTKVTTSTAAPTASSSTTPLSLEKNPINVSEHAIEMMKTLQELEIVSSSTSTSATPDESDLGTRLGLNIPPSSGPDALHSLAVYFANAMENATKSAQTVNTTVETRSEVTSDTSDTTDDNEKIRSAHLRDKTVEGYEKLFQ